MKGNLYKIINDINSKIYIGKTYKTLSERWSGHINSAFKLNDSKTDYEYNYKIYKAIRKYGIEHFQIVLIDRFEEGILEQKEIEYIQKYDSYRNGYNSTLGGDGNKRELKLEGYSEHIIEMYNQGFSIEHIAISMDTSYNSVSNLLKKFNVEIRHETYREDTRIVMYDTYFNPIKIFTNKAEVGEWIINDTEYAYYERTLYTALSNSCKTGCVRYGHRWQLYSDITYNNKVFRTKFDKEAYIEGKQAYQPEGKNYWVVDGALDKLNIHRVKGENCKRCGAAISSGAYCNKCSLDMELDKIVDKYVASVEHESKRIKKLDKTQKCKICGKAITERAITGMCNSCANVDAKGKIPKPSKDELRELLKVYNQKEIADIYDRNTSTVNVWIKSYGLR